tara:strand:- start:77 stop:355 length:279 start_codon:yes stop_codon:yes gene_type:complete
MPRKSALTGGKKKKTLKVKRAMLKKRPKKTIKRKRNTKKVVKKGGAIGFPSRYYGAAHDTSTLTENAKLSTSKPLPANHGWTSFENVGPIVS